jgi:hypothetical protein
MGVPRSRTQFSLRMMLLIVVVAAIGSAFGAWIERGSEARMKHYVFDATLQAERDLGDLSAFVVTSEWKGDDAQVDFRTKDPSRKPQGKRYLVHKCFCGLDVEVKTSPLP